MKRNGTWKSILCILLLLCALLSGCAGQGTAAPPAEETGFFTLSVNPEIRVEYDREGKVVSLTGQNDDGKEIVDGYRDYIGKDCRTVVEELVTAIYQAGYFVADVDGRENSVLIQVASGAMVPNDGFAADLGDGARETVEALQLTAGVVTIGGSDYDPAYAANGGASPYITLEKAQEIALTQANVAAADAVFEDRDFDFERGTPVFELEFTANGVAYEYDIHAGTGQVLKAEAQVIPTPNAAQPTPSGVYDASDYGLTQPTATPAPVQTPVPNRGNSPYTDYGTSPYTDYGTSPYTDYGNSGYSPYTDYGNSGYSPYTDYGHSGYSPYTDYGR